jgi:PAS domain S-box-containing protein
VGLALLACWGTTYLIGGAGVAAPHWFYLPIVLAAAWFGPVGVALTAVSAGILVGPLMPLNVDDGTPQTVLDWGTRAAFFVLIGMLMWIVMERHRRAERRLHRAEQRYRTLVERVPAAVYIDAVDDMSTALYVSPSYEDILGFRPEERLADRELWANQLHPDDREWVLAESRRTNETGEPFRVDYRMIHRDGHTVWVRDEAALITEEDGTHYWMGVLLDITERRNAEDELRQLSERLTTLHDIDTTILSAATPEEIAHRALTHLREMAHCDRAALILFDHDRGVGKFLAVETGTKLGLAEGAEVPLTSLPRIPEEGINVPDTTSDGGPALGQVLEEYTAAGARAVVAMPLTVEGSRIGFLGMLSLTPEAFTQAHVDTLHEVADQLALAIEQARLRDELRSRATELERLVSDLRRTESQRRRLLSRLVHAQEEERARLAADLHDDAVQSMTAVGMRLATIARGIPGTGQEAALRELEAEVAGSVERLRTLTFELRPPALDHPGGLRACLHDLLQVVSRETGARVVLEDLVEDDPPAETRAIAYRIAQETLVNVRKHAKAGEVRVAVRPDGPGVLVEVRDDGVGFDPEKVDGAQPHLGLDTMRERAELAGGWLEVQSTPGLGTTVRFWIPADARELVAS